MKRRWAIVLGLILAGIGAWAAGGLRAAQSPVETGDTQRPGQQRPRPEPDVEGPALPNAEKKALEENDKDMKKKVDRLFELATELKAEVDKTDSSKVLSLNLVKKAEEIEKLARDIKNKSKG